MTPKEFMQKCCWEGGGLEHGFDYGLQVTDLDNSDHTFNEMIKEAESFYRKFEESREKIYEKYGHFEDQED